MVEDAKSMRSVIKNATMGGLGVKGSGDTIATKEEITESREKPETPKLGVGPKISDLGQGLNLKKAQSTPKSEVVSQPKVDSSIQNVGGGISVNQQAPTSSPFENTMNEPINNINVEQFNNEEFKPRESGIELRRAEKPIGSLLKELDRDRQARMSKGVESLYIDAYNRNVKGGTVTIEEILSNPTYQQQFKDIDENVLASMVEDANYLAQFDYNTENVLALMDKYKDLGLSIDTDDLPPQTKAQYIAALMEGNDGGLGGAIDHISPFNILGGAVELTTGVNPRDYNQKLQQWAQDSKEHTLSDTEVKWMIEDQVKALDKKYEKYYTNDLELKDKDLQREVDKEFDKWLGTQMVTTPEQREAKKKEIEEQLGYSNLEREGKNRTDKEKQKEYEKAVKELEKNARKQYGDNTGRYLRNLGLDAVFVVSQGIDLVRNPGSLASGLLRFGKGAVRKSIEGYADLLDTAIATAETVVDKDKKWEGVQYRVGDIYEKVAERKGFDSLDDMIQKMEQASEDNPGLKLATWYVKEAGKDLDTRNAFEDYLKASYGSVENIKRMAKENPVQMASDIISIIQLGTLGAARMGLIDAAKAEQIVRVAGYGDLYEQTLKWGNKLQFGPVLKGEMAVAKAGAKVVGAPLKFAKPVLDTFVNRLSGLTKEEREFIKKNPELTESFLKGSENSQGLLDRILERFNGLMDEKNQLGEEYEKIHQSNKPVVIKNILDNASKILNKYGIELTDEGVKVNKSYTPAIDRKIQELGQFLNDLRRLGNEATAEDAHWLRQQIDTLKKWEGGVTGIEGKADAMFGEIRKVVDNEIRRAVPELKEIDAKYIEKREAIKDLKQDWISKDGTLKDSAYSKIRNITNKGANEPKLARLEKLLPGITEELKGLAVAESVEKAGKQMVGQYASQIFGVGGGIAAITGLLSGGLSAGPIVLGVLGATLATPKNLVKLLKWQGKISSGFDKIIEKIGNGVKLTAGETLDLTRFLNDKKVELKKDAEYLYRKGLITDEEYKAALEKKEKGVEKTGKDGENVEKKKEEKKSSGDAREFLSKKATKEDMEKNIGYYDDAKVEYDEYLGNLAEEVGGKPITTQIKWRNADGSIRKDGIARSDFKQNQKGGYIGAVKDVVRGSIIVDNMEGIDKVLKKLEEQGEVVDNKFKNPTPMGYKDISYNKVMSNGVPTEVQVNVPPMLVAKEGENVVKWGWMSQEKYDEIIKKVGAKGGQGHKFYENWRKLDEEYKELYDKLKDEKGLKGKLGIDERRLNRLIQIEEEMNEWVDASVKYYSEFEKLI